MSPQEFEEEMFELEEEYEYQLAVAKRAEILAEELLFTMKCLDVNYGRGG